MNYSTPIELLTPSMETITIKNLNTKSKVVTIANILTSSPDIQILLENNQSFPLKIQPNTTLSFKVAVTAEEFGDF